jgi:uncharacterized protein (TIGR02270 family)
MADLLTEHFEELSFLWGQRLAALNSPVLTLRGLRDLEERIEAHVEGLLAGGENAVPLLLPGLLEAPANVAFASAYTLLRLEQPAAAQQVWNAFSQAQDVALTGLVQALSACCPPELKPRLIDTAAGAPSVQSAAALEVLAFTSPSDVKAEKVLALLKFEAPRLQQAGWRLVALAGISIPRAHYEKALADKEADTRCECLWAAAWTKQSWLLDFCRKFAVKSPPTDAAFYRLLAVLGQPDDLQRMIYLGKDTALGPQRFAWLGAFGHPGVIDLILAGFKAKNPREAIAAGHVFTKITGFDVASKTRVQLPPEDGHEPDDFEKEFLDDAFLPDFDRAQAHWQKVKDAFAKGTRWCRGHDLSQLPPSPTLDLLDLESRCEAMLRAKNRDLEQGRLADIERFPRSPSLGH